MPQSAPVRAGRHGRSSDGCEAIAGRLEYAFRASPTLREALGQVVRYGRVMHDRVALRLAPRGDAVWLTGTVPPAHPINRYQAEFFLATWLRLARDTSSPDLAPVEVHFDHPAPARVDEHRRFFACPVLFDQPDVGLLIAGADLGRPMHGADPALTALLSRHLDKGSRSSSATPSRARSTAGSSAGPAARRSSSGARPLSGEPPSTSRGR